MPVARPVIFTPDAQADIVAAQDWYEAQGLGLGKRFRAELDATVRRIEAPLQFPECPQKLYRTSDKTA